MCDFAVGNWEASVNQGKYEEENNLGTSKISILNRNQMSSSKSKP